jgi:phosphohistidine phosphatase
MKNLILIRHGKSSWDEPVHDSERQLTAKGIQNSIKIANQTSHLIVPKSEIWSSFANRALQTAKLFVETWNLSIESIQIKKELYTFDAFQLEEIVKSTSNNCESVILFGHNNAITDFVNKFGTTFIDNVPTSGFVSLTFDTDSWSSITKGKTNTIVVPRDYKI